MIFSRNKEADIWKGWRLYIENFIKKAVQFRTAFLFNIWCKIFYLTPCIIFFIIGVRAYKINPAAPQSTTNNIKKS
jgi:hypothetical protein